MKRLKKIIAMLFAASLFASFLGVCLAAPDVIHINMPEAYMLNGPGTEYTISCMITDEDPLTVVSHQDDWLEVTMENGTSGWIHRMLLSPDDQARYPGDTADTPADGSGGGVLDDIRTGFSATGDPDLTATAGTRGIGNDNSGSGRGGKDFRSVQYMESFYISDSELDGFIREGELAP